jgi:hypothetical protein
LAYLLGKFIGVGCLSTTDSNIHRCQLYKDSRHKKY